MCLLLVPGFQGFFFMQPLTVLMKQTRQAGRTIKQSIYLHGYGHNYLQQPGQGVWAKEQSSNPMSMVQVKVSTSIFIA